MVTTQLISVIVFPSKITSLLKSELSRLKLTSVIVEASLCLTGPETNHLLHPNQFSRIVALTYGNEGNVFTYLARAFLACGNVDNSSFKTNCLVPRQYPSM